MADRNAIPPKRTNRIFGVHHDLQNIPDKSVGMTLSVKQLWFTITLIFGSLGGTYYFGSGISTLKSDVQNAENKVKIAQLESQLAIANASTQAQQKENQLEEHRLNIRKKELETNQVKLNAHDSLQKFLFNYNVTLFRSLANHPSAFTLGDLRNLNISFSSDELAETILELTQAGRAQPIEKDGKVVAIKFTRGNYDYADRLLSRLGGTTWPLMDGMQFEASQLDRKPQSKN